MKKAYISVPITGMNYNDQANYAYMVATQLAFQGYDVITPFDIVKDPETPYNEAIGICISKLMECDTIYLCKGWENSRGCKAELQIALIYQKEIVMEHI